MKPSTMIANINRAIDALDTIQRSGDIGIDLDFNIDTLRRDLVRNRTIQERRLGNQPNIFKSIMASLNWEAFFWPRFWYQFLLRVAPHVITRWYQLLLRVAPLGILLYICITFLQCYLFLVMLPECYLFIGRKVTLSDRAVSWHMAVGRKQAWRGLPIEKCSFLSIY